MLRQIISDILLYRNTIEKYQFDETATNSILFCPSSEP